MAHTASSSPKQQRIEWMWKSNADPWSSSEKEQWTPYIDVESIIIEEAFQNKASEVLLDDYHINLRHFVQIANNNSETQRPVKRVIQERDDKIKIREARFIPSDIWPSKSFEQWGSGASNFIFAVRNHFDLDDEFSLDDVPSCRFMVKKAAEGLILEGKMAGKQKIAEWMTEQLLKVKDGPTENVVNVCARLYSMESFLLRKINEVMRLDGDKEKSHLWYSKIPTFGPFTFLLHEMPEHGSESKTTVFRGATLTDELIQQYQNSDKSGYMMFPAFTSTSRNPIVAEIFGGNTIFMIDIVPRKDAIDISSYSAIPDEEELLLHACFEFRVESCTFNNDKNKWIIHLKSFYVQ
ncbi:unnamed protein product [Didymodactylos carnosus]|uniref:NAD(P)(+)--arginine ADP-ribosyltransferase n=1 Tax=Didymodactylos carnosus TaxID=1234261 RepID=A0A814T8X7_9BILA|nr:unnamed protein product [Didymodactylos carnosus]CAF3921653.1 unnamed protein product [Didymodactylos carnosus]